MVIGVLFVVFLWGVLIFSLDVLIVLKVSTHLVVTSKTWHLLSFHIEG